LSPEKVFSFQLSFISNSKNSKKEKTWIPAFAGMTRGGALVIVYSSGWAFIGYWALVLQWALGIWTLGIFPSFVIRH